MAVTIPATGTGPGVASRYPVNLAVSGLVGTVARVTARLNGLSHTFPDDLRVVLVGPGGQNVALMANAGGDVDLVGAVLTFADGAPPLTDAGPLVPGTYAPSVFGAGSTQPAPAPAAPHGSALSVFNHTNPNGTWQLFVFDDASADSGSLGGGFSLTITTFLAQAPTGLVASSIVGNNVTLRWTAPTIGPSPTDYILEGGLFPGQVIASIPTASTSPILSISVPTGLFFVRIRTVAGPSVSPTSNEIQIYVSVPVPPSAPTGLVGVVNGSTVGLAWRNTFGGGAPGQILLEVTGTATATIPLGLTDSFAFAGVPGGTYNLRLRAVNGAGTSGSSNNITLTFPGPCSGPPQTPINFLAYKVGSTIHVLWDPATTGPAPTSFILNVSGSFVATIPTTGRGLSGTVPPGTYVLGVFATNPCGVSAVTPVQVITIP